MISSQNERQRMFGSRPRTKTTSRRSATPDARVIRVVGQLTRRLTPSTSYTDGRLTWKS
jgi:hypothetical protein